MLQKYGGVVGMQYPRYRGMGDVGQSILNVVADRRSLGAVTLAEAAEAKRRAQGYSAPIPIRPSVGDPAALRAAQEIRARYQREHAARDEARREKMRIVATGASAATGAIAGLAASWLTGKSTKKGLIYGTAAGAALAAVSETARVVMSTPWMPLWVVTNFAYDIAERQTR
jgi:hypothetical protein